MRGYVSNVCSSTRLAHEVESIAYAATRSFLTCAAARHLLFARCANLGERRFIANATAGILLRSHLVGAAGRCVYRWKAQGAGRRIRQLGQ